MNEVNTGLIDIYGVIYQPWWHSTTWYVIVSLFICALLGFGIYYLYRLGFFKKKLSFDQQALHDLSLILQRKDMSIDQIKSAYFDLTMIFKIYLTHRYQYELCDKSDIEIMNLMTQKMPSNQIKLLSPVFTRAFAIKFASVPATYNQLSDDIIVIRNFIIENMKTFQPVEHS